VVDNGFLTPNDGPWVYLIKIQVVFLLNNFSDIPIGFPIPTMSLKACKKTIYGYSSSGGTAFLEVFLITRKKS